MKKFYMKPLSEVVETRLVATLLSGSNPNAGFSTNGFDGDDDDSWDVTENS